MQKKTNNTPHISVVIPTYNRAHLIEGSVKSVLNQTYSKFELIIVDDCSTDNTKEVVEAIGDDRIRYVRQEVNGGAAEARNRGIKEARYDWIAFQDSDDVWRPKKLQRQVEAIDGIAGLIYCSLLRHDSKGNELNVLPSEERPADRRNGILFGELLLGNFISTQTMMVHKKILNQSGYFNPELLNHEDYDLLLRISQYTRIKHVDEILVDVYETDGSVGFNPVNYIDSFSTILAEYKDILTEVNLWEYKLSEFYSVAEQVGLQEQAREAIKVKANYEG